MLARVHTISHTLFTGQRERERKNEREKERDKEREGEREMLKKE